MLRLLSCLQLATVLAGFLSAVASQDGKKYTIKMTSDPVPEEISEPVRKLLEPTPIQMLDPDGEPVCDVWLRKEVPADAAPEQVKTGVTYREVKQTEVLGAIQFRKDWTDYRKQKVKAGVYTLRLAYQPTDGKHTDEVSEYRDCVLVTRAKDDLKPDLMEAKALHEASRESIGSPHPGVFMVAPNIKAGKIAELVARPREHWVLNASAALVVEGKATGTRFGIGLTLVGHSPAE